MAMNQREVSELFASYGRKGGASRAKKLTPEQRKKIARQGAKARWSKRTKVA